MEEKEKFILAFNLLNGLMICSAISIAGLGIFIWQIDIPGIIGWEETAFEWQGLATGVLGSFVSVLAWIGTFGVNNENPELVTAYIVIFGTLAIPTLVLGIMVFVFMSTWMAAADSDIYQHMENYYKCPSSANITDAIQLGYECCGMEILPNSYDEKKLPLSCCDPLRFKVTNTMAYCLPEYKFRRTCNSVLTEHLVHFVILLGSLTLLLALLFIGLFVIAILIRRPLQKAAKISKHGMSAKSQAPKPAKNTHSKDSISKPPGTDRIPDKEVKPPAKDSAKFKPPVEEFMSSGTDPATGKESKPSAKDSISGEESKSKSHAKGSR